MLTDSPAGRLRPWSENLAPGSFTFAASSVPAGDGIIPRDILNNSMNAISLGGAILVTATTMSQQVPTTAKRSIRDCFPADCEIRCGGETVAHVRQDGDVIRVVRRDLGAVRVIPADSQAQYRLTELARLWRRSLERMNRI